MQHPPPVASRPIFRWRPDLVRGTPSFRESFLLAAESPVARFQENEKPYFRAMMDDPIEADGNASTHPIRVLSRMLG